MSRAPATYRPGHAQQHRAARLFCRLKALLAPGGMHGHGAVCLAVATRPALGCEFAAVFSMHVYRCGHAPETRLGPRCGGGRRLHGTIRRRIAAVPPEARCAPPHRGQRPQHTTAAARQWWPPCWPACARISSRGTGAGGRRADRHSPVWSLQPAGAVFSSIPQVLQVRQGGRLTRVRRQPPTVAATALTPAGCLVTLPLHCPPLPGDV